jgi:hypothetical protein
VQPHGCLTAVVYDRIMRLTSPLSLVLAVGIGCTQAPTQPMPLSPASCSTSPAPQTAGDQDRDGLDDAMELAWAQQYLPYLSISPEDGCPTAGIIARVTPTGVAGFVRIRYDVLYNDDCGIGPHIGDDERFAMTVDVATPPPDGIVTIKAVSHKGSQCSRESDCGRCPGQSACATLDDNGVPRLAVWASRDKHGNYVDAHSTCQFDNTCLDDCDDNPMAAHLSIVNVGEPCYPLVSNLTTQGFITSGNGWTHPELMNYDPWGGQPFGGGGVIASDLTDPDFDTPPCQ